MPAKKNAEGPWVGSVAVMVSDRERSKEWYTKKLGFHVLMEIDHWVTVGNRRKGGAIHLCLSESGGFPLEPGNTGIELFVAGNLKKECVALKRRGVDFVHQPKKQPWGVWDALIRDPDGNEILLVEGD